MIKNGFILSIIVLLPNLIMLFFPPKEIPPQTPVKGILKVMTGLERIGQISAFLIPFFYSINLSTGFQWLGMVISLIAIVFYYIGWIRYFLGGRNYSLLFTPMLGIPIPMAVGPVIYFLASGIVLNSWLMFIGAMVLAVGHLYVSYHTYVQSRRP